jgi:hypothetical protein
LNDFQGGKGYWFVASEAFQFSYNLPDAGQARLAQDLPEVPQELTFNQSVHQYFYMITDITVGGYELNTGDCLAPTTTSLLYATSQSPVFNS